MAIEISKLNFEKAGAHLPSPAMAYSFEDALLRLIEEDDYWQDSRRYKGPLPPPDDYLAGMALLKRSYAPVLKTRECLNRTVRGTIGKEPDFECVLEGVLVKKRDRRVEGYQSTGIEILADAADDVQGDVWDERGEHKIAKLACRRLISLKKVYLRFDVPAGFIKTIALKDGTETTGIDENDWQKAYRLTHMEVCPRDSASVVIDPETMKEFAFFRYTEPSPSDATKNRDCIQISTVNDDGMTSVRIVRSDNTEPTEWKVDTGGFPLVLKAESEGVVTPDLLQLQDLACSIATMVKINADVAGFPQVDTIDLQSPMKEVPDLDRPGQTKMVPASMPTGPRTIRKHFSYSEEGEDGEPILDDNDKPIVRRGTINYREPVSSQPLRDDIEFFNTEIYRGFNQGHIATRRSANSSAELLVAERADYADSLLETKPDLERLLRNVFKARLCMAAYLAKDAGTLAQFKAGRVRVDLRLNAGPISVEEKNAIQERWTAGLMTQELAMTLLGDADDVQAEILKLGKEAAQPENLNKVSTPTPKATAPKLVANGT